VHRGAQFKHPERTTFLIGIGVSDFRGREILKKFVSNKRLPVKYEIFRNLLLSQMSDDGFQPEGMRGVVGIILDA
jgi:hypothetical protein